VCARACASSRRQMQEVATVTTSVGTEAVMSGLSRAPEKKKRLPVRTSDLSTSGASASLFMDACKSTSSPASSSTWRVDDRVSGRNIPYAHATTRAHVSIQYYSPTATDPDCSHLFYSGPSHKVLRLRGSGKRPCCSFIDNINLHRNSAMHRACASTDPCN
jgi:hypothetical protein